MSLTTFSRSLAAMKTIEDVAAMIETACKQAATAMADIPEPLRSQGLAELVDNVQKWLMPLKGAETIPAAPQNHASDAEPRPQWLLPTPTNALLQLLREFPNGLTLKQVIANLEGRFQSISKKPENILYGTIKRLKESLVMYEEDGILRLMPARAVHISHATPVQKFLDGPIFNRVHAFFKARNFAPATVEEIAVATDTPEASLRHMFNTRHPEYFRAEKIHGNLNRWYMIEQEEEDQIPN